LVHVGRDDQFLDSLERILPDGQEIGDDAGYRAAMVKCGGGQGTHQADRAAAIDEADTVFGEDFAECPGGFDEAGICAWAGATIDTHCSDLAHMVHVALQRKSRQALTDSFGEWNLSA